MWAPPKYARFSSPDKCQQHNFSSPHADDNVSSNLNPRRPEEGQESVDETTSSTPSMRRRSRFASNIPRSSDFYPTILPFKGVEVSSSLTASHGNESSRNAQADVTTLSDVGGGHRAAPRTSTPKVSGEDIANHLEMLGWSTVKIEYKRHETLIHAVLTTELTHCLKEGCRSTNIKANGWTKTQYLGHTPADGRPRRIAYRRQRYYCKKCKKPSLQPVRGRYKGTNMTLRLRRYIARQSMLPDISFTALAKEVGRSVRSIREVFNKHVEHLEAIRGIETPRVMGMDGVYVAKQETLIVTDIERKRVVMLRPSVKERAAEAALREMPNLDRVEEVVADMAGGLDRVQKAVIPKARRTKDRYHAQRFANIAVDVVRKALTPGRRERKKGQMGMCRSHILRKRNFELKDNEPADLDWCLGLYPILRLTYELKEAYCEFWTAPDAATARLKYSEWLEKHKAWKEEMPEDLRGAFDQLIRLMKNWGEGIFNYFHARHTNGYTESANARVKKFVSEAPRAKLTTVNAKIVHGGRLEKQRKAVRDKAKAGRRVQDERGSVPSPQLPGAGASQESPQVCEAHVPAPAPAPALVVETGPRLDMTRLKGYGRTPGSGQDTASTSSQQISLFE